MNARFHPPYGSFRPYGEGEDAAGEASVTGGKKGFTLTPEAQEGLVALIGAGTTLTQKAIEAKAKKKAKGKKKRKAKAAPEAAPASMPSPAPEAPAGVSPQTVLLGLGAFALVGGAVWYVQSRKKAQEAV